MKAPTEQKLLDRCLAALQSLPQTRVDYHPATEDRPSGRLSLQGDWGQTQLRVRLTPRIAPDTLALIDHQLGNAKTGTVLLCAYVGPLQAQDLKQRGLQFVDAEGNAWLNQPPLYLEISGRKRRQPPPRPSRAFTPAGLKLIHTLLQGPNQIRKNYRELAAESGIALGAVGSVLDELKQQGYVQQVGSRRRDLLRSEALLYRWQLGYLEQLRPRLVLETCRLPEGNSSAEMLNNFRRMGESRPLVSGEMGAALLLGQQSFSSLSLHIDPSQLLKTLLQLRLTPDPEGEAIILRHFGHGNEWKGFQPENITLADPLLMHGELAAAGHTSSPLGQQLHDRYLLPRLRGEEVG